MNATRAMPRRSVSRRFNLTLLLLYLLSIGIGAPAIYVVTDREVNAQADRELRLLVDMARSIQGYVAGHMRPFLLERGLFYSAGFSGIVATSLVAEQFKRLQPSYYIKSVSDNPLNPANRPQPFEQQLLNRFRGDRALGEITGVGSINDRRMLVSAAPKKSKKGCLRCHGEPDKTPQEITGRYGVTSGYHYKDGDVVGLSLVGVPLEDVQALATRRGLIAVGLLTSLFAVIFLSINVMVRRSLVRPLLEISKAAQDISQGRMDRPVEVHRNDEVGDLAHSIELLRRSFIQAVKRLSGRK
jgi:HAMP domain-containing protein